MADTYVLGRRVAEKLVEIVRERGGGLGPPVAQPAGRQVTWIKVTGSASGGLYPCTPVHKSPGAALVTFAAAKAMSLGPALKANGFYLALRTGDHTDGTPVYLTNGTSAVTHGKQCDDCTFRFWGDDEDEPEC